MDLLWTIFDTILIIWAILTLGGYLVYKCELREVTSWEEGVKKFFSTVFEFLYEGLTGKENPQKTIHTNFMCRNDEVLELLKRLDRHPYDTPTLVEYIPNANGIAWFDVSAVGLFPAYKDADNKQVAHIAYNIIQNFFMETREVQAYVDIKVATPTRLYFAIPLSVEGMNTLQRQNNNAFIDPKPMNIPGTLEEEISLFEDFDSKDDAP